MPVIFLTSKDEELDEALGLAMGADDYITKPFSQRLLVARVKAILRRATYDRGVSSGDAEPELEPMVRGKLQMDPARHHVKWDGKVADANGDRVYDIGSARQSAGRCAHT
jgi:two-component system, OmpR family, response regulator ChvI